MTRQLPGAGHGGPALRVLAVDDDPAVFALIEAGFADCSIRCELSTATSAPLALAVLVLEGPEGRPHIALVDINMPLVSGFELATQLIAHGVPTVLMSTQVDLERSARTRAIGALDLLRKPADLAGYGAFAARVIGLRSSTAPAGHRPS